MLSKEQISHVNLGRRTLFFVIVLFALNACSGNTNAAKVAGPTPVAPKTVPRISLKPQAPAVLTRDPWMLQDLSILFPIPLHLPDPQAIVHTSAGSRGPLLPDFAAQTLPLLETSLVQATQVSRLQVVGLRVDNDELHLIWQAFTFDNELKKIAALDSAVHTFYRIDDQNSFLSDLQKLAQLSRKEVSAGQSLLVHPTLKAQGWNSAYGVALNQLILKWAGENNLFKITFTASPQLARWFFGGFLIQDKHILPLEIPRISTTGTQLFVNSSSSINFLAGILSPTPPVGQDAFNRLMADSMIPQVKEPQALQSAHLSAIKIQNPRLGNPQTLDCASCHMAQLVSDWTEDKQASLTSDSNGRFLSPLYNLTRVSPEKINTENVRAFGYFKDEPTVSQRAINDTAFAAEQMNPAAKP